MLKMMLTTYLAITLLVMVFITAGLFYAAIIEGSFETFVYGSGLDLFSCMLAFGKDTQTIQLAFIISLIVVLVFFCFVHTYRKVKTQKIRN